MPAAPKKSPAPKPSKAEREALRQQQLAQQQMSALEANAQRLDQLKAWCRERLRGLLELDEAAASQLTGYLVTQSDEELRKWEVGYFKQPVGFAAEYIKQRASLKLQTVMPQKREAADRKKDASAKADRREDRQQRQREAIYKVDVPPLEEDAQSREDQRSESKSRPTRMGSPTPSAASTASGSKKKYSKIGGITDIQKMDVLIPGVCMPCDCEARRHKLIQNCVNCGKIICEQEGRGPCSFCGIPLGALPLSAKQVKDTLIKEDLAEFERKRLLDLQRALAQRDRLLHYEATKAKRTTVIDDQVDYFESTSNQWLTVEERLEAAKREDDVLEAKEAARRRGGAYTVELNLARGLASMTEKPKGLGPGELQAMREEERRQEEARWDPEQQVANTQETLATNEEDGEADRDREGDDAEDGEDGAEGHIFVSDMYRAALVGRPSAVPAEETVGVEEDPDEQAFKERVRNPRVRPHPKLQQAIPFTPSDAPVDEAPQRKGSKKQPPRRPDEEKEVVVRRSKLGSVQNDYWDEDEVVYKTTKKAPKASPWVYVNSPIVQTWPAPPDRGMCLSMHQPWASLLVHGIKRHEGRSWPTDHRGKLWIHAAAHEPAPHDVRTVENFYRGRGATRFPTHYPTSVLLGCVNVVNCLHTDDYKIAIPPEEQESESEYVFICSQSQLLVVPLKMEGKHKIYQLDKKLWQAAQTQAGVH